MFQANNRQVALGVLGLVLAGCSQGGLNQNDDQGIFLRSAIGNTCVEEGDTLTFDIDIRPQGSDEVVESTDGVELSQVFDAGDLDLGDAENLTGVWVGGDWFIPLAPGDYEVTATANQAEGTSIVLQPSVSQMHPVTVEEGGTAETTFTYQCEGQTLSALDVVILVSEGPSIVDWQYGPDKFAMQCETTALTATFSDLQGGPMTVTYELYDAPLDSDPETTQTPVETHTATVDAPAGGSEFSTTWNLAYNGAPGTYYVYVTITNDGTEQSTTFQSLVHIYDAVAGYAKTGTQTYGYNGCEQVDGVLLDATCATGLGYQPAGLMPSLAHVSECLLPNFADDHPECDGENVTWTAPGQYGSGSGTNASGRDPSLPGSTFLTTGCRTNAFATCPWIADDVWGIDGKWYAGKCEAQQDCATYTSSSCAAAPPAGG